MIWFTAFKIIIYRINYITTRTNFTTDYKRRKSKTDFFEIVSGGHTGPPLHTGIFRRKIPVNYCYFYKNLR